MRCGIDRDRPGIDRPRVGLGIRPQLHERIELPVRCRMPPAMFSEHFDGRHPSVPDSCRSIDD
jgi:hypothetical protein